MHPHDEKLLVRQVMDEFLLAEAPDRRAEAGRDFESLYGKTLASLQESEDGGIRPGERSLPFDPAFGAGMLVGTALWIVVSLVREVLAAPDEKQRQKSLKKLESRLWRETGRPEIVIDLLSRVLAAFERLPGNPDLWVLVDRDTRENRLRYRLKSEDAELGFTWKSFVSPRLEQEPLDYFGRIVSDVDQLRNRNASDRAVSERKLESIGTSLSHQLLPPDLRDLLWSLQGSVETVEMVSEEPWIPWELLRIWPREGGPPAGRFLGEAFSMTHWISHRDSPVQWQEILRFPLRSLAAVLVRSKDLKYVEIERELLLTLMSEERKVFSVTADYTSVTDALQSGDFDGFHFSGHGVAPGPVDRWGVILEDGESLTGQDMDRAAEGLGKTRPLVFLNACSSVRSGPLLTGIGGLARRCLEAGAGAVIGSHWPVRDEQAAIFAEAFYPLFLTGRPLGESVRRSRLVLKDRFPGDPAWLGYTVFGHPLAAMSG